MKRVMKWAAIALSALLVLAISGLSIGAFAADRKASRTLALRVGSVPLLDDAEHLARGGYLFASRGCAECHGADGAGREFVNDGGLRAVAPNLTPGTGSAVLDYTAQDWVRSIRHGVSPEGRPLMIMPSEDYAGMGDEDLGALVAYIARLPAVSGKAAAIELPIVLKALYAAGVIQDAAEKIDHAVRPRVPPPRAADAVYGAYVAQMCTGCHGAGLSGGKIPGGPPDWPAAANLTGGEGSVMQHYPSADALRAMLRTGKRADGSVVSAAMPFGSLKHLDDVDVQAVFAYLGTLPPRAAGGR